MPSQYKAGGKLVDSAEFKRFRSDMVLAFCRANGLEEFDIMHRAYEKKQQRGVKPKSNSSENKKGTTYTNRNDRLRAAVIDVSRRARTRKEFEYILMREYNIVFRWDRMSIKEKDDERYRRLNKMQLPDSVFERCKALSKKDDKRIDDNLKEIYLRYEAENKSVQDEIIRIRKYIESNSFRKAKIKSDQRDILNYIINELGWREDGTRRGALELLLILAMVMITNEAPETLLNTKSQININKKRAYISRAIKYAESNDIRSQDKIKELLQDPDLTKEEVFSLLILDSELRSSSNLIKHIEKVREKSSYQR